MNNIIIANIILGISLIANVITMQQKEKKQILIGFLIVNILCAITYFILKSYSAVLVGIISIVQTYIKYLFDKKEKNVPTIVQILFIIVSILSGIFTFTNIFDILPIFASVTYTLSILQQKEKNIRLLILLNTSSWMIYDIYVKAYIGVLFSICTVASTIIAMVRYDSNKKEKINN